MGFRLNSKITELKTILHLFITFINREINIMGNEGDCCEKVYIESFELNAPKSQLRINQKVINKDQIRKSNEATDHLQEIAREINKEEDKNGSISQNNLAAKINSKISLQHQLVLNEQTMIMIGDEPSLLRRISSQLLGVPYSVIRLTVSQKLNKVITELGEQIFSKYEQQQRQTYQWKLHKKGYYINYLGRKLFGLLTQNCYYEGQLVQNAYDFQPINDGILMTQSGIYQGHFEHGKANGQGYFKSIEYHTLYKGIWQQGIMVQGTIQNSEFKFVGKFLDGQAIGKGRVYFKKSKFIYEGGFSQGLFHDQEAVLESDQYIYKGGFCNGKKEGKGCLIEKQKMVKKKGEAYHPNELLDGNWHQDYFNGVKKYVTSVKKFRIE